MTGTAYRVGSSEFTIDPRDDLVPGFVLVMKRDSMTEIETSTEEDAGALQLPSFHQQSSLREQVADALRAHLVSGRMRPGVLYSAPKLAAEFGVSATPVRRPCSTQ